MAAKHWVRDVQLINQKDYIAGGNHLRNNAILFHFLRTAGFKWLWESCDTELVTNKVPDGNMEEATAGKWTEYGGAVAPTKETTGATTGRQRLKVVASGSGQGVESDPLTNMPSPTARTTDAGDLLSGPVNGVMTLYDDSETHGTGWVNSRVVITGATSGDNNGVFRIVDVHPIQYNQFARYLDFYNPDGVGEAFESGGYTIQQRIELVVLAANNGSTWNVRVDPGTGTFATVGTIPNNGGTATVYKFTFYTEGGGNKLLRFESTGQGTLYLDAVNVHRSQFEEWKWAEGTDGIVANGDEFSTGGSFTADNEVIGKHLFLFDTAHPENSGCFEILADMGGGSIQVDLRSATFQFTDSSSIAWRIVQIYNIYESPMADWMRGAGYGLESPHSSKWRFFLRQNQNSAQASKNSQYWAAPEDTDFDWSTGNFWSYAGPSSQRGREAQYLFSTSSTPNIHTWRGSYTYGGADTTTRTFAMTDANGSFLHFIQVDMSGSNHQGFFAGFMRETPPDGFSAIEMFAIWGPWGDLGQHNCFYFDDQYYRIGRYGTVFGANEAAVEGTLLQHGIGTSSAEVETDSQAGPNPFTNREWLRPLIFGRDWAADDGDPAYFNADEIIYQGRANLPAMTPFGEDDSGTGDSITAGTPAYITDAAGEFTSTMIGRWVTITGAPTANNNGVFKVTGVPDANTLQYTNPLAASEAAPSMTWSVSNFAFFHVYNGWVLPWMGAALAS